MSVCTKALRSYGTGRHVPCSTWHELVGILVSCHIGGPLYCPPAAARAKNLPSSPSPSPRVLRHQRDPSPRLGRWVGWWLRVVVDYRTNPEAVLWVSCWDTSKCGGDTKGWCRAHSVTSLKTTGFQNPETVIFHQLCLRGKLNFFYFFNFAAKLGDTKELEDFIADLDRTLASEYMRGV